MAAFPAFSTSSRRTAFGHFLLSAATGLTSTFRQQQCRHVQPVWIGSGVAEPGGFLSVHLGGRTEAMDLKERRPYASGSIYSSMVASRAFSFIAA